MTPSPPTDLRPSMNPGAAAKEAFNGPFLSVTDAIYLSVTVRDFRPEIVPAASIHALLYAAVQAPTVESSHHYAFAILQGRQILAELSDWSVRPFNAFGDQAHEAPPSRGLDYTSDDDCNIFFNAATLVVLYGQFKEPLSVADVWLAAGNLILSACGMGLGTCIVANAVEALNSREWRVRMKVPQHLSAIAPVLVGVPAGRVSVSPRKAPDIISWST